MRQFLARSSRASARAAPARDRYRGMQALAWGSLVAALAVLVAVAALLPRAAGALFSGVSEPRATVAEVIEGTVLFQPPAIATWQRLAGRANLAEGTRLRTDDRSRVFLQTREGSTVLLYNETELAVQRMQYGRFNPAVQDTVFRLFRGRVQIGVALHSEAPGREISLLAGQGRIDLGEGSYRIELEADGSTHLSVRQGAAKLWSGSRVLEVPTGQRAVLTRDARITGPLPLERDLVRDPLFERRVDGSPWSQFVVTEAGAAGSVAQTPDGVRFERRTPDGGTDRHGESGLVQELDRDVRDYVQLRLRADVRTEVQTLSGGGTAGTEYPLMLRLNYLDADGHEQIWATGFYHQNDAGLSVNLGQEIPAGAWITYDNPRLLQEIRPAPVRLLRVEVLGSGWEYRSAVRRVELTGH